MKTIGISLELFTIDNKRYMGQDRFYFDAVDKMKARPVGIALTKEKAIDDILDGLDGLILTGGTSVNPKFYNHPNMNPKYNYENERDDFEIKLIKRMVERKIPFIGICRGLQVTNVALGGSLFQNVNKEIENSFNHQDKEAEYKNFHHITIKEDSNLYKLLGPSLRVNSYHLQAARGISPLFEVVAMADDGVVEAMETKDDEYIRLYQFHPEKELDRKEFLKLFLDFSKHLVEKEKRKIPEKSFLEKNHESMLHYLYPYEKRLDQALYLTRSLED